MKFKIGHFQWNSRTEHRRLAALMAIALIALIAGIFVFVRIVRMPLPVTVPSVTQAKQGFNLERLSASARNQILADEALLLDPAPLFLPTQYNVTQTDVTPLNYRTPGKTFGAIPESFVYPAENFAITFPDTSKLPPTPVETLALSQASTPFALFGRFERVDAPLPARMGFVEIANMKTGRVQLALPLELPKSENADTAPAQPAVLADTDWSPVEFLVSLNAFGLTGAPTLVQSSGSPAVDQFLESFLVKKLHLGTRLDLPAGLYYLRIGP